MSTVKSKNLQIGTDGTASNNFTIYQPGTPDGTLRVGNGNVGSATDAVTINSSGNVGIGTSSPTAKLDLLTSGAANVALFRAGAGQNSFLSVIGNGNSFLSTSFDIVQNSNNEAEIALRANAPMKFYTNNTERMRIDGSGRVTTPSQPHIMGTPTNTSGSGLANSFATTTSQGGLAFVTDRITVPVAGVYLITFNTICDNTTGRVDAKVHVNGGEKFNTLSEDNGTGHHYRGVSNTIKLQANDYIQFSNNDWYDASNTGGTQWRTASVTLIG